MGQEKERTTALASFGIDTFLTFFPSPSLLWLIPPYIFSFPNTLEGHQREILSSCVSTAFLFSFSFFSNSLRSGKWITKNDFLYSCFWFPPFFFWPKKKKIGVTEKVQKKYGMAVIFNTRLVFCFLSSALSVWIGIWEKTFDCDGFKFDIFMFPMLLLPLSVFFSSSLLLLGTQSHWWPAAYCGHFNPPASS